MRILDAKIDWFVGAANHPTLKVLVDRRYNYQEFKYEQHQNLFFGERDGQVSFFAYSAPGEGYGGHRFNIEMKDGSARELIGPWSSGTYATNMFFTPAMEVSITDKPEVMECGYTFYAGYITLPMVLEAIKVLRIKHNEQVYLMIEDWSDNVRPRRHYPYTAYETMQTQHKSFVFTLSKSPVEYIKEFSNRNYDSRTSRLITHEDKKFVGGDPQTKYMDNSGKIVTVNV